MTSEKDILTALIALLKTEWGEGYRYYTKEHIEGYVMPCFFVDVFTTSEQYHGANTYLKRCTCLIDFLQETRDQELTLAFVDGLRELLLETNKRQMILKVETDDVIRFLSVDDFSFSYVGQSNNIPEITFSLEFHDSYAEKDTSDLMRHINTKYTVVGGK